MKHKSYRALALGLAAAQFIPLSSYAASAETTDSEPQAPAAVAEISAPNAEAQSAPVLGVGEFSSVKAGEKQAIVVTNKSNGELVITKVELTAGDEYFTITGGDVEIKITSGAANSDAWEITPKETLAAGTYNGTLRFNYKIVSGNDNAVTTSSCDVAFEIVVAAADALDLTGATVELEGAADLVYTGEELKPAVKSVTLKDSDTVVPAEDYEVVYADNINVGTATVTVTPKDKTKYTGTAETTFEIGKGKQEAPGKPELASKSRNSITIKAVADSPVGAKAEYSIDGGEKWQDELVFSGLKSSTKYSIVARYKATDNYDASPASEALEVTTSSSGSGSGSGSGGSYRPSRPSASSGSSSETPSSPTTPSGESKSWTDISKDISAAKAGSTVSVVLGSDGTVPADVLVAAANNDTKLSLKVDSTFTWEIDGANISGQVSSANFGVKSETVPVQAVTMPALMNCDSTKAISVSGVPFGFKPVLTANLGAKEAGKFANLYKVNATTGALEFAGVTQVDADGNAVIPLSENGKFVIAVDSETKMMGDFDNSMDINALDAAALLKEIVSVQTTGAYKADADGDGKVDVWDAVKILKTIVGLE